MTFADLQLDPTLLQAVTAEGYTNPTPIQFQAIPHVLKGVDLLGCAQTGTGKTAAFALPILQRLMRHPQTQGRRPIRPLVLAPTRELATQIGESFRNYGRHTKIRATVIFGGVGQNPQVASLKAGVDVVVATPGRLLDLMNQGHVDFRQLECLVLDEADNMLDMGFIHDIRKIIARIPAQRQTLLFSATMPREIRQLADTILHQPVSVQVAPVATPAEAVDQWLYHVEKSNKPGLLVEFLQSFGTERVLVFTRTKHGADKVVKHLVRFGIRAEAIHGNKSQNARVRALNAFKSQQPPVLVATDIAARGLDIDNVSHVVNFDIPNVPETYVHRIGRTGRAGASGSAISFCDHEERPFVRDIERLIRRAIPTRTTPSDLPKAKPLPAPHPVYSPHATTSGHTPPVKQEEPRKPYVHVQHHGAPSQQQHPHHPPRPQPHHKPAKPFKSKHRPGGGATHQGGSSSGRPGHPIFGKNTSGHRPHHKGGQGHQRRFH